MLKSNKITAALPRSGWKIIYAKMFRRYQQQPFRLSIFVYHCNFELSWRQCSSNTIDPGRDLALLELNISS
jgi:hypothetical protein